MNKKEKQTNSTEKQNLEVLDHQQLLNIRGGKTGRRLFRKLELKS